MQPEIGGFVPAVFLQDRIGRGYGLGGQRVQVYIIVIGVEIPRCIALQCCISAAFSASET